MTLRTAVESAVADAQCLIHGGYPCSHSPCKVAAIAASPAVRAEMERVLRQQGLRGYQVDLAVAAILAALGVDHAS